MLPAMCDRFPFEIAKVSEIVQLLAGLTIGTNHRFDAIYGFSVLYTIGKLSARDARRLRSRLNSTCLGLQ